MKTNIKNLPAGNYFTERGYSDTHAWVEVSRTAKTVTIAKVAIDPDPEWKDKMQMQAGGFAGHCSNQSEQTWLFKKVRADVTKTIRQTNLGWSWKGIVFDEGKAYEFYDYNF